MIRPKGIIYVNCTCARDFTVIESMLASGSYFKCPHNGMNGCNASYESDYIKRHQQGGILTPQKLNDSNYDSYLREN